MYICIYIWYICSDMCADACTCKKALQRRKQMVLCLYEYSIICSKALTYCKNVHQRKAEAREIYLYVYSSMPNF